MIEWLTRLGEPLFFIVTVVAFLLALLGGDFSTIQVKNARQYIQYCLCFLPLPDKKLAHR